MRLELRRGALPLAVLLHLKHEHYGYSLRKAIADKGLDIDEGTLYPLIRRLETHGLLNSEWRTEDNRQRRFYQLSPLGFEVTELLILEWQQLNSSIEKMQWEE